MKRLVLTSLAALAAALAPSHLCAAPPAPESAAAPSAPPPRLSVLMGVTDDWQRAAQAARAHDGTLLGGQFAEADLLPAADPFTAFNALTTAVRQVARDADDRPANVRPAAAAEDAPVVLPDSARPADAAASGFAPHVTPASAARRWQADDFAAPATSRTTGLIDGDSLAARTAPAAPGSSGGFTRATSASVPVPGALAAPGAALAERVTRSVVSPAAGVFASPGPNVTLANAIPAGRVRAALVAAGVAAPANTGPAPNSQIGLSTLITVDQQNTAGSNNQTITPTGTGNGQSFTPSLNTLNAITVSLFTTGVASTTGGVANAVAGSSTVRVDLFASATGYTNLLASSAPVTFTNTSYQTIEFDFATLQTVTPGNVYSFRMVLVSGDRISYQFSSTNTYAGGNALTVTTGGVATGDVVFAEGIGSTVPEPSTWAGGALLLAGAGWTLRRRLRAAAV